MKSSLKLFFSLIVLMSLGSICFAEKDTKKIKVFILAGQSNMEGKAKVSLLEHQISQPETADRFKHFHQDGKFIERDDVWINYLNRHGKLTVGYGSPNRIGVELEFGHIMGNHFEEPVLLIKTAWGGKSIGKDFRPPSAGLPSEEILQAELDKANEQNKKKNRPLMTMAELKNRYGHFYRLMIEDIKSTLADLENRFPEYQGQGYELAGFVWFQGWNDQYNEDFYKNYGKYLKHLIQDVRKEFNVPKLPVVVGLMGQNGFKEATGPMADIKKAQWEIQFDPELKGTVKSIKTDVHWDKTAAEIYPEWRKRFEEWEKVGSDFAYHYMGSTFTFCDIGKSMAEAMLELQPKK